MSLTEERNAVCVPSPNSAIPGAPADWNPPNGIEKHIPVLYLDAAGSKSGINGTKRLLNRRSGSAKKTKTSKIVNTQLIRKSTIVGSSNLKN